MNAKPEWIAVEQDADGFWSCREARSGSQQYVRADLFDQAIQALKSLTDGDAVYVGEEIRIRCNNHGDAIRRMAFARAIVAWDAQFNPNKVAAA